MTTLARIEATTRKFVLTTLCEINGREPDTTTVERITRALVANILRVRSPH